MNSNDKGKKIKNRKKCKKHGRLLSIAVSFLTAILILSASVSAPILIRPFYYVQIEMRGLEETTGYTYGQIKEAYDDMLDYCIGISSDFKTGTLAWSESGRDHFTDVRGLFLLDIIVMTVSIVLMIIYLICSRLTGKVPYHFMGHTPYYYGSIGLLAVFTVVGVLCALDFDRAFTVFHTIFFPGKDNWIFDYETDEIIRILPEGFFASCGVLILTVMLVLCAILITISVIKKRHDVPLSHF